MEQATHSGGGGGVGWNTALGQPLVMTLEALVRLPGIALVVPSRSFSIPIGSCKWRMLQPDIRNLLIPALFNIG